MGRAGTSASSLSLASSTAETVGVIVLSIGASFFIPTISDSGVVGAGSVVGVAVGNAAFSSLRSCTLLATAPGKPKPRPATEPRIPDSIIRFQSSDVNLSGLFAIYFSAAMLIAS